MASESNVDDGDFRGKEREDEWSELQGGEPKLERFQVRKQGFVGGDGAKLQNRENFGGQGA